MDTLQISVGEKHATPYEMEKNRFRSKKRPDSILSNILLLQENQLKRRESKFYPPTLKLTGLLTNKHRQLPREL
jgi:hypothetical protein